MENGYYAITILGVRIPKQGMFSMSSISPVTTESGGDPILYRFRDNLYIVPTEQKSFIGMCVVTNCKKKESRVITGSSFELVRSQLDIALQEYGLEKYMETFGVYTVPVVSKQ